MPILVDNFYFEIQTVLILSLNPSFELLLKIQFQVKITHFNETIRNCYYLFHLLRLEISWKLELSTLFFFKESHKDSYGLNKININITQQAYLPSCTD